LFDLNHRSRVVSWLRNGYLLLKERLYIGTGGRGYGGARVPMVEPSPVSIYISDRKDRKDKADINA
jgi:hypothetical protein